MRRRYQEGSLREENGRWIAQWWDDGKRKKRTLGKTSKVTKSAAKAMLAEIIAPINARYGSPSSNVGFREFVEGVFLPFYRRKWKRSTARTNEDRYKCCLFPKLGQSKLRDLNRENLQGFLDKLAAEGQAFNTISHVRWDLRQILRMATVEGYLSRNPAELLFIPRESPRPDGRVMTREEVRRCLEAFTGRASLVMKLAILVGLRPGEIFALRCGSIGEGSIRVCERVYRGDLDSPKSKQSLRDAATPEQLIEEIRFWMQILRDPSEGAWLFPSETGKTPVSKDNVWRREIQPVLDRLGLGWVNFHVTRRTHATLMREEGADAKLVADNMGHTVDVNQNVYTRTPLAQRRTAVDALAMGVLVN